MTSVIFMGTPEFSVPVLEGLIENNYEIKAVVTQPDKKVDVSKKLLRVQLRLLQKNIIYLFTNLQNYLALTKCKN